MNTHESKKSNTHGHEFSDTHYGRFSWFFMLSFLTFKFEFMGRNKEYRKLINTRKWQKLRLRALSKTNHLCAVCLKNDITTPATEVHHIVPVESGTNNMHMKQLCYDPNNLLSVCKDCHKKEHIKLQSYTKNEVQKRNDTRTKDFTNKFLKQKKARTPLQ